MNCFEIRVGDNVYKFTNNNNDQSESFDGSDWSIVSNFMTKGKLPSGWEIDGDLSPSIVLNSIMTSINNGGFITTLDGSEDYIINNLIGNASFNDISTEQSLYPERNVMILKNFSPGSNYYGINKNRIILITSDRFWSKQDFNRIVYDTYNMLKLGNKKAISSINNLYKELEGGNEIDVYKQMSILVNKHSEIFGKKFYSPYNNRIKKPTKSDIKNSFNKYKNSYIILSYKEGSEKYFIARRFDENSDKIYGIEVSVNDGSHKESVIDISNFISRNVYYPVMFNGNMLINKQWFNSNYKLLDKDTNDNLFRNYLADDNEFSVDLKNYKILGRDIKEYIEKLNGEVKVITNRGLYIKKDGSKQFVLDGDDNIKLTNEVKILRVSYDVGSNVEFHNFISSTIESKPLTIPLVKLLVANDYEERGVSVRANFDVSSRVSIVKSNDIHRYFEVRLTYGNTPIYYDINLAMLLEAAIKYVNDLNSDPQKIDSEIYNKWNIIRNSILNRTDAGDLQEYVDHAIASTIDFNISRMDDIIEENTEQFIPTKTLKEIDDFTSKLIDLGLYSHICKL